MGRAGRFGTKGLALTFVATDEDSEADSCAKRFVNSIQAAITRTCAVRDTVSKRPR